MIALIEYGAGNTASVSNALKSVGASFIITSKEHEICAADKVIFPGVGEASSAVRQLHMTNLFNLLRIIKKPLLGICVGMQLLADKSEEGNATCLGVFPVTSVKFDDKKVKVPHMGWNRVNSIKESKLFYEIKNNEFFYYANSYYVPQNEYAIAVTDHDVTFTAAMQKNNYYGVQFHPEKSGPAGIKLLKNFVELC